MGYTFSFSRANIGFFGISVSINYNSEEISIFYMLIYEFSNYARLTLFVFKFYGSISDYLINDIYCFTKGKHCFFGDLCITKLKFKIVSTFRMYQSIIVFGEFSIMVTSLYIYIYIIHKSKKMKACSKKKVRWYQKKKEFIGSRQKLLIVDHNYHH